jgi:hypothetical protein
MNVYRSDTLGNTHSLEYIKSVHKGSQLALLNATHAIDGILCEEVTFKRLGTLQ